MKDINFYLIHNNASERIHLRNRLKTLSKNLNIDLIEIHKQKNDRITNFNLRLKLKVLII